MKKTIKILIILLLFPSWGITNTITTVTKTPTTITISGSDFGVKTTASPYKWDDFSGGIVGEAVSNGWSATGSTNIPTYTNTITRQGRDISALCDMATGVDPYNSSIGLTVTPSTFGQKFYISYWRYDVRTGTGFNYKPMRIYGNAPDTFPQAFFNEYDFQNSIFGFYNAGGVSISQYVNFDIPQGVWTREEYYLDAGSQGVADAYFSFTVDGAEVVALTDKLILTTEYKFSSIRIGHFFSQDNGTLLAYISDIYIDNTQARVEIGNNSVFANCTQREIQPATSWTTTEIVVDMNPGSFPIDTTERYLFVVDADGVASAGYPITLATGTAPTNVISTANNQAVINSAFMIQGTATATTGRTITGVTIPGETVTADDGTFDSISEAWTCNVALSEGVNSYTATATDSAAETGTASITATLETIPPVYTSAVKKAKLKKAVLK